MCWPTFSKHIYPLFGKIAPKTFFFGALRSTYGEEFTFIPFNILEQIFTEVIIPLLVSMLIEFYLCKYQYVLSSYSMYPFVNFTGIYLVYIILIDTLITSLSPVYLLKIWNRSSIHSHQRAAHDFLFSKV